MWFQVCALQYCSKYPSVHKWFESQQIEFLLIFQFSSVAQSCPTLCDPMNRSTPGLPVHHQLPEFIQTHIHRVSDAIQPSHPLSSPSPPALNPSQHESLFQWVNSSNKVAKYWSFSFSIIPSKEKPFSRRYSCPSLGVLIPLFQKHCWASSTYTMFGTISSERNIGLTYTFSWFWFKIVYCVHGD